MYRRTIIIVVLASDVKSILLHLYHRINKFI